MPSRWHGVMQRLWGGAVALWPRAVLTAGWGPWQGTGMCTERGGAALEGKQPRTWEGLRFWGKKELKAGLAGSGESSKPPRSGRLAPRGPWLGLGLGVHSLHSLHPTHCKEGSTRDSEEAVCCDL